MAAKKNEPAGADKPARAKRATAKRATAKRATAKRKQATPTHEEIATRAYYLAQESGTSDPLHNWLRAEGEMTTGEQTAARKPTSVALLETFERKPRAPITVMRRPRIRQCHQHCQDPASLPDGAGIPASRARRSGKIH